MLRRHPLLVVLLLAAAAYAVVFLVSVKRPDRPLLLSDANYYASVARSLDRGQGYIDTYVRPVQVGILETGPPQPCTFWSPAYPALTAVAFRATGSHSSYVPIVVNGVGFLVALILLGLAARDAGTGRSGFLVPLMVALNPYTWLAAVDGITEGWFAAFLAACLFLALQTRRNLGGFLCGLALGLAALTRLNGLSLVVPLALTMGMGASASLSPHHRLRRLAWLVVGWLLVLLPWVAYRLLTFGDPFFEIQQFVTLHRVQDWTSPELFRHLHVPFPSQIPLAAWTGKLDQVGEIVGIWRVMLDPPGLLLLAGGLTVLWRQRHWVVLWLAVAVPALITASSIMAHPSPRYLLPGLVALAFPMAAAVEALWDGGRRQRWLAVAAVTLLAAWAWGGFLRYELRYKAPPELTETQRRTLASAVAAAVPESAVLVTDQEFLVWYADRQVVWSPVLDRDLRPLVQLSGATHALWNAETDPVWAALCREAVTRGHLLPVTTWGTYRVGTWTYP